VSDLLDRSRTSVKTISAQELALQLRDKTFV
jgi:hypothetical protein